MEPVLRYLRNQSSRYRKHGIGAWGLAIKDAALYDYAAENAAVVADIVRQCREDQEYAVHSGGWVTPNY